MDSHKKVGAKDWLGDSSDESEAADFDRPLVHDDKKGRLMFELQKSYGGDRRFKLDKDFMDDLEEEKMPEKVKLSIASAGFAKLDTEKREMDHTLEKERHFDILQQILPNANLKINTKPVKEFKAVARYDPTALTAAQHETKIDKKPETKTQNGKNNANSKEHKKGKKLDQDLNLNINKGIDKKKVQIDRADRIIQKSIQTFASNSNKQEKGQNAQVEAVKPKKVKKHIVKEIKKQKWNEIATQREELSGFKLFG